MHVTRLDIRGLRRFADIRLDPAPGINLITGENGAGKTSVLEALHLMAYGRSFRGRVRDGLIRVGDPALEIFVEWQDGSSGTAQGPGNGGTGRLRRAGLRHSGQDWTGRLDGREVDQLGDLCAALAVVSFEPGSHALITGGSESRRRYLDWGLFHVEPEFLALWRRYARALKQRNALLKRHARAGEVEAWDRELAEAGEPLGRYRQLYLESLQPHVAGLARDLAPALGEVTLEYLPGWRRDQLSLADALLVARDRDLAAGHTSVGPHRADWRIAFTGIPGREALSRGQAKLTALATLLGQAEHHAAARQDWPVVALDDLASELDRNHQQRVLERLRASGAQVLITGTELPAGLGAANAGFRRFHVEHGLMGNPEDLAPSVPTARSAP
ncbi:DNA replication/repair protein RecF [Lysobacter niastensis]|uniref:DNA replication and repair protein RecF n=1 Tax=Lysobacter niastensis TaxID=380629 RepID=A0ABS0B4B0_9GAMM|nr:DNA replication/repair protein RecF [Lysobacter niastensis]MBF6023258.1 DNA replication/repair protein RecF [Lysobacter niastensis]